MNHLKIPKHTKQKWKKKRKIFLHGLVENSHWLWSYLSDVRLTLLDPQPSRMVCTSPTSHHQQPGRCGPVGSPVEADRQQANVQRHGNVYDQFCNTAMRYPSHLPYHYTPAPPHTCMTWDGRWRIL